MVQGPGWGARVGAAEAEAEAEADADADAEAEAEAVVVHSGQGPWDLVQWWWSQVLEEAEAVVEGRDSVDAAVLLAGGIAADGGRLPAGGLTVVASGDCSNQHLSFLMLAD